MRGDCQVKLSYVFYCNGADLYKNQISVIIIVFHNVLASLIQEGNEHFNLFGRKVSAVKEHR